MTIVMNKKINLLILLFVIAISALGSNKSGYDYLLSSSSYRDSIEICSVERTKSQTSISISCKSFYSGVAISFSSNGYLEDENHHRYHIKYVQDYALDKTINLNYNEIRNFKLIFEPLPKHVKCFDYINKQNDINIFGIHQEHTKFSVPIIDKNIGKITKWNHLINRGKAVIKGKFEGKDKPELLVLTHNNIISGCQDNFVMTVNPDGSFNNKIEIDIPQVLCYQINSQWYYTAIDPGKVTEMYFDKKNDISFSETTPFSHLLNMMNWTEWAYNEICSKVSDSTLNYLIYRFNLDPQESHLAFNNVKLAKMSSDYNYQLCLEGLAGTPEIKDYYCLRNYDPKDLSLFICDNRFVNSEYLNCFFTKETLQLNDSIYKTNDASKLISVSDSLLYGASSPSSLYMLSIIRKSNWINFVKDEKHLAKRISEYRPMIKDSCLLTTFDRYISEYKNAKDFIKLSPDNKPAQYLDSLLYQYRGKNVIIEFWSPSCGPCLKDIVSSKYQRMGIKKYKDLQLIYISDSYGSEEQYQNFANQYLQGEKALRIPNYLMQGLRGVLNFNATPYTIEVLPDGSINVNSDIRINGTKGAEESIRKFLKLPDEKYVSEYKYIKNYITQYPENPAVQYMDSLLSQYKGKHIIVEFWSPSSSLCMGEITFSKDQRAELKKNKDLQLIYITDSSLSEESYKNIVDNSLNGEKTIRVPDYLFEDFRSIFNVDVFPHTIDVLPDGKINSNSAIIINGTPESEKMISNFEKTSN